MNQNLTNNPCIEKQNVFTNTTSNLLSASSVCVTIFISNPIICLSFVSSPSVPTDTDNHYEASRAARMPRTNTTSNLLSAALALFENPYLKPNILFVFCVITQRPDRYRQFLWGIPSSQNVSYQHQFKSSVCIFGVCENPYLKPNILFEFCVITQRPDRYRQPV